MAPARLAEDPMPSGADYESAGVSTDNADAGLDRIKSLIGTTWPAAGTGRVLLELGQFANVVEIGGVGIAFSTDGVGSKVLVAEMLGKYDTVGIDCVAMNVNDLLCVGATPVSLVDYIGIEAADPEMLAAIGEGLVAGAKMAGISITGGEISQLPEIIRGVGEGAGFDLVGAAIGHVAPDRILVGQGIEPGDAVIGVASTGIHSNGFTLARKVLLEHAGLALDAVPEGLGRPLGAELIEPTAIYVSEAVAIMERIAGLKGFAHITGDGLLNLNRLQATVRYVIDDPLPVHPIFDLIQRLGDVPDEEMYDVFNMGTGFCVIVAEADADATLAILAEHGRAAQRIGTVEASEAKQVTIPSKRLVGEAKHFRKTAG